MGTDDCSPVLKLSEVGGAQGDRFKALGQFFEKKYGQPPEFYVRAPGRVNLIGEHIDYCGYSVFPMAVQQDIVMAVRGVSKPTISLANMDPSYADFSCSTEKLSVERPSGSVPWSSYVLCGVLGVQEHCRLAALRGLQVAVSGSIPASSGLSSSSALVCAASLATLHANQVSLSKSEVAGVCAHAERYIGTEGGGMDQAICFLAKKGTAKLIEFNPLRAHDVQLPPGAVFVIANSLAEKNKAASSDYNCRVMECRLATQLLAKSRGLEWSKFRRLGDLQKELKLEFSEMVDMVRTVLHEQPYSKKEICSELGVTEQQLDEITLSENTRHIDQFLPYQRALHVFSEAGRVFAFRSVCESGGEDVLSRMGQLMNESHASCRDQYECSHELLDTICRIAEGVAYGARLTGAGWGGCTVALVPGDRVDEYISKLKTEFYARRPTAEGLDLDTVVFRTEPGDGAAIYM
ncbi:N-acetylgalactosamine kinase [Amphibalanus amphitrite]|uniref:N-acetylgalactosamine kinase n=1 Tax=Amphibalanus amphitrite TaxID=1232801 RepID=A0A6A4UYL7_AMPAM|nr:N-acetylgalactosamine kinase [Amphibalanus amphitrite]KAF0286934.1 N-acetylgalactosamine kinase [Amphibalanus amphitrite]